MDFAKKTRIELSKQFGKEPQFSKWLASEGIEYIKEALGIELIPEGTEVKPNKKFSADIVLSVDPQYSNNGKPAKVVIENQYGRTDHEHFSKLITYAVTNEAKYAVWIAEEIHPEHKASVDWLNDNTNDNINFYVFKAIIEQIGNSEKSFSLIPICEPKEELKINMSEKRELTDLKLVQLMFWKNFSQFIDAGDYQFKSRKAQPQHWYTLSVGKSGCNISICMLSLEKKCRFDLWISNNKELFDRMYREKEQIEKDVGRTLIWDRKDQDVKASSISYQLPQEIDIYNEEKYDEYASLMLKELEDHFYKIVSHIK